MEWNRARHCMRPCSSPFYLTPMETLRGRYSYCNCIPILQMRKWRHKEVQ